MATLVRRNGSELDVRDPFLDLDRLEDQIDAMLDRAFTSLRRSRLWSGAFTPLADIEESDDAYVIEIELPGVSRDDTSVEVRGRRVIVSGERKERERNGIFRTKARVTGRFHYEAALPGDIDADAVTAEYKDGVLVVRAPKPESERSKARKIKIN
jgi:HSP20 family protein